MVKQDQSVQWVQLVSLVEMASPARMGDPDETE